jgi:DnaJ-class molecular chaperone
MNMGGMNMGGPGIRVFHSNGNGGGVEHFFQQMNKPPPIIKKVQISMEQAYTGANVPVEIEKQISRNGMRLTEIQTIHVQIPPGIDENEVIILRDQGHVLNDSISGDIKLTVEIRNTTVFERHGTDLIYKKHLSLKEALCGFSFELAHLNGKMINMNNISNSSIVKPNYKKVVPGLGMQKNGQTGNLVIEMFVDFPDTLTREQMDTLRNIL